MAHPKAPNQRKAYTAHFNRVERYAALMDAIYVESIKEFSRLAISVGDPSKPFQFSDYPHIKSKVASLQKEIAANIKGVIVNGVTAEWNESNFKDDALARSVVGIDKFDIDDKGRDKIPASFKPYFNNNTDALKSFMDRKNSGLGLSDRVWKLAEQYKSDIELALSVGMADGRSAGELSRDVRQYLNEPNKLFRRVMQNDKLRLSKAAKAYHPGRGVYRSSYKNAMRLTRTEINAAYRTADSKRWQQMDFVVGFEVKRSGRGYDCSVCESLAGKYPKGFVFTGWHPHCRCYVIPVLEADHEFWAWDGRGEAPTSINEVIDVPQGFKEWAQTNRERIAKAQDNGTLPYFLRDNGKYLDAPKMAAVKGASIDNKSIDYSQRNDDKIASTTIQLSPLGVAKQRHAVRTAQQIEDIQNRWGERKAKNSTYAKIAQGENGIRMNAKFETAILYDKEGNVLLDKRGKATSVSFSKEDCHLMKDGILTHNHPRGWRYAENKLGHIGNSFSPADICTAVSTDLAEIRAVTPTYTFSMKRPADGWGVSADVIRDEIKKMEKDVIDQLKTYVVNNRGDSGVERARVVTYHRLSKKIASKYGWSYSKAKTR